MHIPQIYATFWHFVALPPLLFRLLRHARRLRPASWRRLFVHIDENREIYSRFVCFGYDLFIIIIYNKDKYLCFGGSLSREFCIYERSRIQSQNLFVDRIYPEHSRCNYVPAMLSSGKRRIGLFHFRTSSPLAR